MQLLFAAPFIAAALLTFLTCIVISGARKHALSCLVAILASGLGVVLGFLMMIFITDWLLHMKNAGNAWFFTAAALGGTGAFLLAAFSVRMVVRLTSATILQWIVFVVCFANLFGDSVLLLSASLHRTYLRTDGRMLAVLFLTLPIFISLYPSILLARSSEQFRPRPLRGHLNIPHDNISGRLP